MALNEDKEKLKMNIVIEFDDGMQLELVARVQTVAGRRKLMQHTELPADKKAAIEKAIKAAYEKK